MNSRIIPPIYFADGSKGNAFNTPFDFGAIHKLSWKSIPIKKSLRIIIFFVVGECIKLGEASG